jgi:2-polyprenyl-3-methyl-5-hydroxy-6-metoxy-1,4-benzoquinol methylase
MELTFEDFKKNAINNDLNHYEKIGFPNSYRENRDKLILKDIISKTNLNEISNQKILDIGCGCSELVNLLINYSNKNSKKLYLNDSSEMIDQITANLNGVVLKKGKFSKNMFTKEKFDVIIVYSVIQYIFNEQNIYGFIHECIDLLNEGGSLLLGDIPNFSSRKRFLDSNEGVSFLNNKTDIKAPIHYDEERIDDSIVLSILNRYRNFGIETYLMPQLKGLPFSNRREDILLIKRK